jgi:hypothetical protein
MWLRGPFSVPGRNTDVPEVRMAIRKTTSHIDREGIFTDSRIEVGTLVHTMSGEQISMPTLGWRWFSGKFRSIDDPLELDFFHFLILDSFSLSFNHSCDPNCGFRNLLDLHAIRTIEAGEELTFDYSLNARGIYFWWRMSCLCKCGAKNCRGLVSTIATLPDSAYDRYLSMGVIPKQFRISRRLTIGSWRLGI